MQNGPDGFYIMLSLIAERFVGNKYADCGENERYAGYYIAEVL
jgi:hypothetical protein